MQTSSSSKTPNELDIIYWTKGKKMKRQTAKARDFKAELTAMMENMNQTGEPVKLNKKLRQRILEIYAGNSEGTIATLRPDGWPQANVVDFWYVGLTLYFGTFALSQKAKNIERDPRISLTITPPFKDFGVMAGISMAGRAEKVTDKREIGDTYHLFLERLPHMVEFAHYEGETAYPGPGMAVYRIRPEIVSMLDYSKGYGHVDLLKIGEEDMYIQNESIK